MDDHLVRRALTGFVKQVFNLRLLALVLTLVWMSLGDLEDVSVVSLLLLATAVTSLAPVLYWDRIGGPALRHPLLLSVDILVSVAILMLLSVDSPFVLFVLATAILAGALHDVWGAAASSGALLLAYLAGLVSTGTVETLTFSEALGMPALIPLAAIGGVAIRRLLLSQAAAARQQAETALSSAAAMERTRLAREMHDSLAKTLQGISLTASTMPALVHDQPAAAADLARTVAETARQAAAEARALLVDLRADDLERPLGESLVDLASQWSARTGISVVTDCDPCERTSPSSRYEIFCIVREALRNVAAHADASQVTLSLHQNDDVVVATVVDDGVGFVMPGDVSALADAGHFGVVGMSERAETVGGTVHVSSRPRHGTRVTIEAPVTAPGDRQTPLRPADRSQTAAQ